MTAPNPPRKKLDWKWWAIGGVGVVAAVYWYSKKTKAAATTAPISADTSATDSSTSGLDSTDLYGSDSSGYYDYSTGTYGGTAPYPSPYGSPYGYPPGSTTYVPTTNAQWAQQAETLLVQENFDATQVAIALGKYLTGQALTSDQLSIVQAAIALEGEPPQSVPPPHTTPSTGQTATLMTPSIGWASRTRTSATLSISPVPNAFFYQIYLNGRPLEQTTSTQYRTTRHGVFTVRAIHRPGTSFADSGMSNGLTI